MKAPVYLGLVHGPVVNKFGQEVVTSVTNMDIHDLARTARTYGAKGLFLITPLQVQHELVQRILGFWQKDESGEYNPDRQDALQFVSLVFNIEEARQKVTDAEGQNPLTAVTGAKFSEGDGDTQDLKNKIKLDNRPLLLLFGTGWGLAPQVVQEADFCLRHLKGAALDGYNHLSVRSAVAIYCDRLLSEQNENG